MTFAGFYGFANANILSLGTIGLITNCNPQSQSSNSFDYSSGPTPAKLKGPGMIITTVIIFLVIIVVAAIVLYIVYQKLRKQHAEALAKQSYGFKDKLGLELESIDASGSEETPKPS